MSERIPQSVAKLVVFRAYLASDGKTPATGKTIAITISKNGATSFSNPAAGATNATEMASGFYKFTLGTGDTDTKGPLSYRGAEGTIDDVGDVFTVVNATNADFTALPAAAADAAGGLPISDAGGLDLDSIKVDTAAILVDTGTTLDGRIPAALISGRMDVTVGAMQANVLTAAAAASDLTTELQSGLATAANLATVAGYVDTEVAALVTAVADLPTNAELATALGTADDAVLAAVATAQADLDILTGADGANIATGAIKDASFATTAGPVAALGIADQGTAQSATATTVVLRSAAAFADDTLIGATIFVFGSTQGYWQSAQISDNVLSTDTVTVPTWPVTPSGTITYKIFGTPAVASSGGGLDASGIRDALGMASADLDTQLDALKSDTAAILVDTAEIGAAGAGLTNINLPNQTMDIVGNITGNLSGSVGSVGANGITAASLAADVATELQAGLATASALATVAGYIDTEVAALVTAVDALPTNAEFATALAGADDATLAAIAALNNLSAAQVNAEVDSALSDYDGPTNAEVTSAVASARLSSAGVDDILDEAVEGAITLRQAVRLWNAVLGGKASGLATTTATYRDLADSKDRVVATVDSSGNRTAITRDLT